MTPVIHCTEKGSHAFAAVSLETGDRAVIVTTPRKPRKADK